MWIIYSIVFIIIILLLFSKLLLNFIFSKRCDGNPKLKYFTSNDFEELEAKSIEFKSNKGQTLRGNIYTYKNIDSYKGLVIFSHGFGGGHLSYTTEINTLAKAGFIVVGYDNTGTFSSEGKNLVGFFQAVIDLKNAISFVEANKELNRYPIHLVGHSWGAYAVCQVLQFKQNIKSVVALSGFNNTSKIILDTIKEQTKISCMFLKPFIILINFFTFGRNGIKNTVSILENTEVPVLLLHGKKDIRINLSNSLVIDNDKLLGKSNIKKIIYNNKSHNVYQTIDSEQYLNATFESIANLNKEYKGKQLEEQSNKLYESIDYKKITEEDPEVMNMIIEFLTE